MNLVPTKAIVTIARRMVEQTADNDPRHGTVAGYNRIPCRDDCCKLAMARYKKRHAWDRMNGRQRIVSTLGTRRRVQALNRLGWSNQVIAREAGVHPPNMTRLLNRSDTMTVTVAARIADVYERLSMTLPPPSQAVANVRNRARRLGYPPPLAWDDIDNDPEPQWGGRDCDVDPVVVMRLLEGRRVQSTRAEKEAAMARWVADGGSRNELAKWHGWKPERYTGGLRLVRGGAA